VVVINAHPLAIPRSRKGRRVFTPEEIASRPSTLAATSSRRFQSYHGRNATPAPAPVTMLASGRQRWIYDGKHEFQALSKTVFEQQAPYGRLAEN
jgi:hypothetical protein